MRSIDSLRGAHIVRVLQRPISGSSRNGPAAAGTLAQGVVEVLEARQLLSAGYYQLTLSGPHGDYPVPGQTLYLKPDVSTNDYTTDLFQGLAAGNTDAAAALVSADVTGTIDVGSTGGGPEDDVYYTWEGDNGTDDTHDFKIANVAYHDDAEGDYFTGEILYNGNLTGSGSPVYYHYTNFSFSPLEVTISREQDGVERLEGQSTGQDAKFRVTTNGIIEGSACTVQVGVDTFNSTAAVGDQVDAPPSDVILTNADVPDGANYMTKVFTVPVLQNNKVEGNTLLYTAVTGGDANAFGSEDAATIVDTDDATITIGDDPAGVSVGDNSELDVQYLDHYGDPATGTLHVTDFDSDVLAPTTGSVNVVNGHGTLEVTGVAAGYPNRPLLLADVAGNTGAAQPAVNHDVVTITDLGPLSTHVGQDITVHVKVTKPDGQTPVPNDKVNLTYDTHYIDTTNAADGGQGATSATTDASGIATFTLRGFKKSTDLQGNQSTIELHARRDKDAAADAFADVAVMGIKLTVDKNAASFSIGTNTTDTIKATVTSEDGMTPLPNINLSAQITKPETDLFGRRVKVTPGSGTTDASGNISFVVGPGSNPQQDDYTLSISAGAGASQDVTVTAKQ